MTRKRRSESFYLWLHSMLHWSVAEDDRCGQARHMGKSTITSAWSTNTPTDPALLPPAGRSLAAGMKSESTAWELQETPKSVDSPSTPKVLPRSDGTYPIAMPGTTIAV